MQTLFKCDCDMSIIIPVYNLERFILPMLDSLAAQDFGDYKVEIIFVLNNCTDRSGDLIRESDLDCTIINCNIQGCGPARNAALEIAGGKYIWFMDGDDWLLSSTAVRDVLDKMTAEKLSIVRIPFRSNSFHWNYFSMVWQYCMRRSLIDDFRFPNYQPAEDDAFMTDMLYRAGYGLFDYLQMPAMNEPLYYYNYLREGSNMYRCNILGEQI